jgi:hypothetical protein
MKQILMLVIIGLAMLAAAGCVSPAVNTPTPTSAATPVPTTYVSSPVVTYYPSPTPTNATAYYSVVGSVAAHDGTALKDYTVVITCYGVGGISSQYFGPTDANGSYDISFSSPQGYYDRYSITVIAPGNQLAYQDEGTRTLTGNETADILL